MGRGGSNGLPCRRHEPCSVRKVHTMSEEYPKRVKFRNGVSWGGTDAQGVEFNYIPRQIIELDEVIAKARQDAGLGTIVKDHKDK